MKRALPMLLSLCAVPALAADVPGGGISADNLSRHVRVLASDAFEGRAPATPGEDKTIAYVVDALKQAGVQPGGEEGGWTQAVPLVRAQVEGAVTASLRIGGETQVLANGEDVVLQSLSPVDRIALADAPLVFVGYGIDAPERGWDDFKDADLAGKVAVVLVNDPDFETDAPGAFDGRAVTYYGRWTYKYEELARQGAAGVLIVHETAPAAYGWATVRASGLSAVFDIPRPDAAKYHTRLRGWMQRDLAVSLFKRAGLDFDAEKRRAQTKAFTPVALGDATLSAAFAIKRDQVVTRNVIGRLEGAQRPDETVIYSAHWDAFGIGEPDAAGDPVRHGAVDNATGVAAVIELARVFAAGPRPQRTLLFMALTAEEKGLQGATFYAANPLVPLAKTAAVLNIEMLSPDGPTRDIASWGNGRVSLEGDLKRVAEAQGRTYSPDPNLEAGFFYRADHFAFARAGVPAITVGAGLDRMDGGVASGKALRDAYFAKCYHQACDAWTSTWNAHGQTQDVEILYVLGREIADGDTWPHWLDGSEFRAARERSRAERE
ncbi:MULTISPECIES: M28 family metallopeptidase [unclassified Pseudoxanthomonas]|uniref:M28 family metallopeptidase n=1 Tax=unclassified Pseudoxanthomonas TaxID=2645906 RepID=UPI0008F408EA|nr:MULTISPECIES: M28 family metallopeptidase [unclassified Pseudoxanthomonas]PPJ41471.1 peptidase M20 [Pseudoxanthomonas sp. KAs_5_3]SFV30214.1 Zn-dependent amino-or carboxypeptidase, M28 family [Pseudoxanthomonas sp. YR558]